MKHSIERESYSILLDEPKLYVDNRSRRRSGHMSHAMTEFAPDTFIDFNSNCSPVRIGGHSAYGWIEYRISRDAGRSFSDTYVLPYAKQAFEDGLFTVSVEKAVSCKENHIVAFCLRNSTERAGCCEPWFTPMAVISQDAGQSWGEPIEVSPYAGRIYDAVYHDGLIYLLQFCNDAQEMFVGTQPEHQYRLFVSRDEGKSFSELCVIPFASTIGRGYGSMLFDDNGLLHIYAYNIHAEREMDHIVSKDGGMTWGCSEVCALAKGIRNPQTAIIDGVFILHGRAEEGKGFVLYSSLDGSTWDEGVYLEREKYSCYYSNNLLLRDPDGGHALLIQYSDTYEEARVNVMHMWLRIQKAGQSE